MLTFAVSLLFILTANHFHQLNGVVKDGDHVDVGSLLMETSEDV